MVQDPKDACCQVPYCDYVNPSPFPHGIPTPAPNPFQTPLPGQVTVAPQPVTRPPPGKLHEIYKTKMIKNIFYITKLNKDRHR
jgi:hypothetical protein